MRLNLPTWLTLFRILLLPVMVAVYYSHAMIPMIPLRFANVGAAVIFLAAAITDWFDGYLARRWNQTSAFGAFLDPVADKLMVTVTLFLLVQSHPTALLAVTGAIIVGREIGISALREWMAELGLRSRVRVAMLGKVKTVMQIIAIVVLLLEHDKDAQALRKWYVGESLLVLAAGLTIWSGLVYLRAAWPVLRDNQNMPETP
ncbi:CDP-diacylglycerol--glycerol-3-phosphate 3-phosphatidyltransferase [Oleiagrimonas sp.]|jgi:CDP-diacylglycerol--glycerol-3-phosphate 3-phosphatidyltransferase|uniref:CDP-diacylglycerol--glycerol-3-phosphate 3-phosphatidyltransferase n=1 Tax=Oleiagrimonas sp. TaxID=2010330 RepID=UPI0026346AB7|nr:CDP-diacylglycerol--glycerol-3-phosphate 3-phosphatidyltransferase [Oleiagrimonas sp.]MDA3913114.1 CDP-diacylglycerol--glycerol-3-phosphate 3-phosphatidyltransferase [Oleiagrimonas sp.]